MNKMRIKWNVFVVLLAVITSQVHPHSAVNTETSEEYLRKVMIELQEMKQAMPTVPVYLRGNQQFLAGKRLLNTNANSLRFPHNQNGQNAQYYQVPRRGQVLPFTKNELNSIYKQAMESGNLISVDSLKNVLAGGQLPVADSNNQAGNVRPMYAYDFYPTQPFMSDVRNNNGFGEVDSPMESTNPFEESQKQMVINPLFMAISGFVGMAVVFMLGVLVMPRLFPDFKSRFAHDELLDLTKTVSDAIESYNKTTATIQPKKHYRERIIGIKTSPHQGTSVRNRNKIRHKI